MDNNSKAATPVNLLAYSGTDPIPVTIVGDILDNCCNFPITRYGAVGDGVTDCTAAFAAAYALAAAQPGGGNVVIPAVGKFRIRSKRLFDNSVDPANPTPVFVVGLGEWPSTLLWDPIDPTQDFLCYRGAGASYYFGGGVRNVAIVSANPLASGVAIRLTQAQNMQLANVVVRGFLGLGTGTGVLVESGDPSTPSQNIDLDRVEVQGNCVGVDLACAEMTIRKLLLNQNVNAHGVIRGGSFYTDGGMIQGDGASLEFRPASTRAIYWNARGVTHWEVNGAPAIKAYPAPGPSYGGEIGFADVINNGDDIIVDADFYTVRMENISSFGLVTFGKLRTCGLTADGCVAAAAQWDLDAFSLANAIFQNEGHLSIGRLPNAPSIVPRSAAFALPIELASLTQTERDALTGVADGWTFFNASARRGQQYVAGRVKPWVCLAPANALEIWPALMHHFATSVGANPTAWADMIGDYVLTPSGTQPLLEADGKHFNGLPAYKLLLSGANILDSGSSGATMFPAGTTEFYVRLIARRSVALASAFGTFLNLTNNAANLIMAQVMDNFSDGAFEGAFEAGRTNFGPPLVPDSVPHKFELYFSPTHQLFSIDGVPIADTGPSVAISQPIERICLGGFPGYGFYENCNLVDLKIGPTRPTGDTALALDELDYNLYGVG
jgi:hypothetical protein